MRPLVASNGRVVEASSSVRIPPGAAPGAPGAGDTYFDTTALKVRTFDGLAWVDWQ